MNFSGTHIDRVYFLGIGGIGMSALARYFRREGVHVSGYDRSPSKVTLALEEEGIVVFYEQDPAHLVGQDLVIYTPAVPQDAPELVAARAGGHWLKKRAEVLGMLTRSYQTLAVAGTHGKTTTSTMLAHFLRHGGIDASAFLGGISRNLEGNFVHGNAPWLITEADEYDRSFLHLTPHTGIITSLDPDHLDIYGSEAEMIESYRQFGAQCEHLLLHHSIGGADWGASAATYGIESGDHRAENLRSEGLGIRFDYRDDQHRLRDLYLPMPGRHNVLNATAALALSLRCGLAEERAAAALASFAGIYRRFEVMFHTTALSHVDDYAHHPTEIEAALEAAKAALPERQVLAIFQPHLYSRTRDFAAGFADALAKADLVLLMDIYPARELPIPGISAESIASLMPPAKVIRVTRADLLDQLAKVLQPPTVVLTLGAGDIDRETDRIRDFLIHFFTQFTAAQPHR